MGALVFHGSRASRGRRVYGFLVNTMRQSAGRILGAAVLRTQDAGHSWQSIPVKGNHRLLIQHIWFIAKPTGFAATVKSLLRTTDGGANWRASRAGNRETGGPS